MEIPTYPYNKELLNNKTMWPWFFKDMLYKGYLSKYIDRICTFSDDEYIYGIKTINICNGICIDNFHAEYNKKEKDDCINLLTVAQFQKSHGYERIIKGLKKYYEDNKIKKRVVFHMVGYGEELSYYKSLVKKYKLQDYVILYGKKIGKDLNDIYNIADIGLGCFGLYKRKIEISSALKTREYLAHGLPVVSGAFEDAFEKESCEYYLQFPNDKSEVSIMEIVSFYNALLRKYNVEKLKNNIFCYAKRNVDMKVVMRPIIDYIINFEN